MSVNANLNELLQQFPELLSWIVPGLLFMFGFQRFKYEEYRNEKERISVLNAICISFFIRYTVITLLLRFPGDSLWGFDRNFWIAICSCSIALLFGALFGWVSNLSVVKRVSEKHLHLTIDSNPFFDLADKKRGCYVRVYLKANKGEYVYGIYSNCYNRVNEDWVVVKNAIRVKGKLDVNTENLYSPPQNARTTKLLINTKEIELIEYVYPFTNQSK